MEYLRLAGGGVDAEIDCLEGHRKGQEGEGEEKAHSERRPRISVWGKCDERLSAG